MKSLLIMLLAAVTLAACDAKPTADEGVSATLRQADTEGFERAYAPRPFSFPADHGPHRDFRDEWWYVTGNLDGPAGRRFGFQITFFRHGLKREKIARPSHWSGQDIVMAHLALTDVEGQRYTSFQRVSREAIGLAGSAGDPFKVWLDDWSLVAGSAGGFPWHLHAAEEGYALDLDFDPRKPIVLNGHEGLSQKSAEPGNASYYYSITRMAATGTLRIGGAALPVSGLAWLDREWSTSMLADNQSGWDWFSLQLADGSELMYFHLRRKDGSDDPASAGSWVGLDGHKSPLARDDIAVEVLDHWQSPGGYPYPSRWRLTVNSTRQRLDIKPVLADQEFRHDAHYWEGAVDVTDTETGQPLGRGYVELTGYAPGRVERSGD